MNNDKNNNPAHKLRSYFGSRDLASNYSVGSLRAFRHVCVSDVVVFQAVVLAAAAEYRGLFKEAGGSFCRFTLWGEASIPCVRLCFGSLLAAPLPG